MNAPESPGGIAATAPEAAGDALWYKDAVIYQLHVKAFFDSNDDGIGDFRGLTSKLDYVRDLGVNTVWLLPFYPSPQRDDGYDVADYNNVYEPYGTRADFRQFVREAHERGLRVITELVVNTRPTSIPGSRPRAGHPRAPPSAISMSGATPRTSTAARASSSRTPRRPTGRGIPSRRPISGTASSATSRTSTSTIRRC